MSAREIAEGHKRFGVSGKTGVSAAPIESQRPAARQGLCCSTTPKAMKTATFDVNGVNSRLPVLLRRLQETSPAASCRLPGGDTSFQRFLRIGVCFFLRRERHF
jgi:hypothetical protein